MYADLRPTIPLSRTRNAKRETRMTIASEQTLGQTAARGHLRPAQTSSSTASVPFEMSSDETSPTPENRGLLFFRSPPTVEG